MWKFQKLWISGTYWKHASKLLNVWSFAYFTAIGNPKPDHHNINAHAKFGENPLMFTLESYHRETKYGRTDGRTTDKNQIFSFGIANRQI